MCVCARMCVPCTRFSVLALPGGDVHPCIPVVLLPGPPPGVRGALLTDDVTRKATDRMGDCTPWPVVPHSVLLQPQGCHCSAWPSRASAIPARERLFFECALPVTPSALCVPVLPDMAGAPSYHLKAIWEPRRRQHPQQKKPCAFGHYWERLWIKARGGEGCPSLNPLMQVRFDRGERVEGEAVPLTKGLASARTFPPIVL